MYELFKGYVPTRSKRCSISFKGKTSDELMSLETVHKLEEYAGILNDNTVLIDIDNFDQSEILMKIVTDLKLKCRVYKTSRGKHFLFQNNDQISSNKVHCNLAIGLESDIKLGIKSSYSILKYGNVEREILYDANEYETVPKWLVPIKTNVDFLNMETGDGRNQALFNYILTLQSNNFSVEEARETLKLINKYILTDPLSDTELETVMRDEAFQKESFFNKGAFLFDRFANYIKNNNHVIRLNNKLYFYNEGVYRLGEERLIEGEMIKVIPNLNRAKRKEVIDYLDLTISEESNACPATLIAFSNGIYNLETGELQDFDPNIIITNKINYDYVKDSYCEITDKTLNKLSCNDKSVRSLLEESIGYCFFRRNELRKLFILTGEKQNGKSTYLTMIEHLLGKDNTSSLDLSELGDRFKTANLVGKLANIGDDIGDEFIPNPAVLKKLASGNPITVEQKGKDPFEFSNYSKLFFSANNIPRMKDKSGAVQSRLVIVPFNARFTVDDPDYDPYIIDKLLTRQSMEYLICLGIEGLKRVMRTQSFTKSKRVEESLREYERENNPIIEYFDEITEDDVLNEDRDKLYSHYCNFCSKNNFNALSSNEFTKKINKKFDTKLVRRSIKNKTKKFYVKLNEEEE